MNLRAPQLSTLPQPQSEPFRILVLSDLHIPAHLEATRLIFDNAPHLRRMDFVVLLGDMVGSYGTPREYEHIAKFLKQLERPYAAIPGNHEFYFETDEDLQWGKGSRWEEATADIKVGKLSNFRAFYGIEQLWRAQHTPLGSFLFLSLDDVEQTKPETISLEQRAWLQEQLQVQPELPAYIFCHAPVMFERRLDMTYYDEYRTACVEFAPDDFAAFVERKAPVFWMSGHIHLRPDHYMFPAYLAHNNVWQVHCPDSWGYSRWLREQHSPQRHGDIYSRHLEVAHNELALVTHHHNKREDIARQTINW
ncbi:MAG TPA: metallophosphoesterase [Abditibacteriaceae bacterium]|jgi:3',5'-cyclic AMP phosphodiesterase CpdA